MNFWKDGLSVDETKFSALVVGFVTALVFGLVMCLKQGDIPINLLSVIKYLIMAITGVNVASMAKDAVMDYKGEANG